MIRRTLLTTLAVLAAILPWAGRAQTPPVPAPEPSQPSEETPGPSMVPAPKPTPAPAAKPTVTITPYGFVLLQSFWNAGPFSTKDYPGQVLTNGDGGAFLMSARGTRFGLKVALPDDPWTGATLNAVIEGDFKGGYAPSSYTTTCVNSTTAGAPPNCTTVSNVSSASWYNALFRIRLGYAQASWGGPESKLSIVAGQDWKIVAPLAPTSLAFGYDQIFTQAGNLNNRDIQLKAIYDMAPKSGLGLNVQANMVSPQDTFLLLPAGNVDYGAGNRSRYPNFEARVAANYKDDGKKVAEVGVSGGVGWRRYNASATPNATTDTTTKIVALDGVLNLPLVTVQGEAFASDGMEDSYTSLLTSSVLSSGTTGAPTLTNLQSQGGWIQAVLKPIPQVSIPVGYGVENVRFRGITYAAGTRTRNAQFHTALILNANAPWKFGFEYVHTVSGYGAATPPAVQSISANQYVLVSKLDF